jgi:hypothetical protein
MQRKIRGRILVRRGMRQSGCSESLNSNIKPDVRMARVSGTGFRLVPHLQVFDQTPSHTIFGATPRELESARGASSSVNAQQKKKKLRMLFHAEVPICAAANRPPLSGLVQRMIEQHSVVYHAARSALLANPTGCSEVLFDVERQFDFHFLARHTELSAGQLAICRKKPAGGVLPS